MKNLNNRPSLKIADFGLSKKLKG